MFEAELKEDTCNLEGLKCDPMHVCYHMRGESEWPLAGWDTSAHDTFRSSSDATEPSPEAGGPVEKRGKEVAWRSTPRGFRVFTQCRLLHAPLLGRGRRISINLLSEREEIGRKGL